MSLILEAIRTQHLTGKIDGEVGVECEGSKFHSPTPLRVTHVDIASMVAPRLGHSEKVWLCGVCQDNLRIFLLLMESSEGRLGWAIRREFGNRIRDLGMRAWAHYEEGQHA